MTDQRVAASARNNPSAACGGTSPFRGGSRIDKHTKSLPFGSGSRIDKHTKSLPFGSGSRIGKHTKSLP